MPDFRHKPYPLATWTAAAAAGGGGGVEAPAARGAASVFESALERYCPLCHQTVGASVGRDSRCPGCHSPLGPLPGPGRAAQEWLGRRGAVRRDQNHVALVHVGWPSPATPVRWRDLSLTGLSLYMPQPIAPGQRLRVIDSALEVVAEVVDCRPQGRVFTVHARLLTALLLQSTGVFVSAQA